MEYELLNGHLAFLFHSENEFFSKFAQHENFVSSLSIDYIFKYFQCCCVCSIWINNWRVVCLYVKHTNRHNANDKRSQHWIWVTSAGILFMENCLLFAYEIQRLMLTLSIRIMFSRKMYGPFHWKSYFVSSISEAHNINHSFWKWKSFLCNGFIVEWAQTKANQITYRKKDSK